MPYFHPLNFIRFILATGVVLFHYGVNYYPFNTPILKALILHSSFRVSFFFFISGFVMTLVYSKQSQNLTPTAFYKKRFARIFPVYWLAFVCTLLLVLFVNNSLPKGLIILLHAFGLQSWDPGYVLDLNFTTWTISVELFFYLLFPFLLKWIVLLSDQKLLLVSFIVWVLQSIQHIAFIELLPYHGKVTEEFISTFPLWHLSTFFVGMATARLILNGSIKSFFNDYSLLFLALSLAIFGYVLFVPNPILKYIHNGLLSPLFSLFIIALFYDTSLLNRFLSLKPISKLGDLSYGLFIFQYPLWIICTKIFNATFVVSSWFFFIYFILLMVVSWVINKVFEKPMLQLLRKER